jgi:hypothetical protein
MTRENLTSLDARAYAATLSTHESPIERFMAGHTVGHAMGRVFLHWVALPYRLLNVSASGLAALFNEMPRRRLSEQPIIAIRITFVTLHHVLIELLSAFEPLLCGFTRLIRTKNIVDLRAAPLFTRGTVDFDPYSAQSFLPHYQVDEPLQFSRVDGHCWGMCVWFIALYQALSKRCPDVDQRMRVVARQFEDGTPKEALLLQAIGDSRPKHTWLGALSPNISDLWRALSVPLLRRNGTLAVERQEGSLAPLAGVTVKGSRRIEEDGGTFSRLGNGCYLVRRINDDRHHEMVYIKISETLSYTWDPIYGLNAHHGPEQGRDAQYQLGVPVTHTSGKDPQGAWVTQVS